MDLPKITPRTLRDKLTQILRSADFTRASLVDYVLRPGGRAGPGPGDAPVPHPGHAGQRRGQRRGPVDPPFTPPGRSG